MHVCQGSAFQLGFLPSKPYVFFRNLALNSCYTEKKKFTINLAFFPRTEKTYISKHASETHLEAIT